MHKNGFTEKNYINFANSKIEKFDGKTLKVDQIQSALEEITNLNKDLKIEKTSFLKSITLINDANKLVKKCSKVGIPISDISSQINNNYQNAYVRQYSDCDPVFEKCISNMRFFFYSDLIPNSSNFISVGIPVVLSHPAAS